MKYFVFGLLAAAAAMAVKHVWTPTVAVKKCRVELITAGRVDTMWADVRVGGWIEMERDSPMVMVNVRFAPEAK